MKGIYPEGQGVNTNKKAKIEIPVPGTQSPIYKPAIPDSEIINDSGATDTLKLEKIKTIPYKNNYGYIFTSGPNTWHGMEKKEIIKERRCLQVNYVTFPTDWKVE